MNEVARNMADRDFRFERHYELWKEQNKQVARWAIGTAIFAGILVLKVLTPYVDFSGQVGKLQAELAQVRGELVTIEAQRKGLEKVGERLRVVSDTIEKQPWTVERDRLVEVLRDLDGAYRMLSNASPAQVQEAIREPIGTPQAPIGQQMAPPPRPRHPLADAAAEFRLSDDQLTGVSSAAFGALLEQQLSRRVQEEADNKVRRIVLQVNDGVIQPLERLLGDDPEARNPLAAMSPMLARARANMDRWARQHIGNRDWYATIQGKDRELAELTAFLRRRQEEFIGLVRAQQQTLEAKRKALSGRQEQVQDQVTKIGKGLDDLSTKMQKLLPEWLRDLVSPAEMLELYPLVLLGLVGVISFKAGLVRHHYLVVREGLRPQGLSLRDSAVSSLWTLVYRGTVGTGVTAAMYLGGTLLLWWLFERGSFLAGAWLPGQPSPLWAAAKGWLPVIRWLGRLLFAAAVVGVVATLLKDRAAVCRGRFAAATSAPGAE